MPVAGDLRPWQGRLAGEKLGWVGFDHSAGRDEADSLTERPASRLCRRTLSRCGGNPGRSRRGIAALAEGAPAGRQS